MATTTNQYRGSGDLWMVLAVIQPFRLDAVTLALESLPGFGGMTVTECRGFGREKLRGEDSAGEADATGGQAPRRTEPSLVDFTEKVKLEVAVAGRDQAGAVIEAIARTAHTGNRGDGKVLAWPLDRAVRIRTFDEGATAL